MPHEIGRGSRGARFAAASMLVALAAGCGAAAPKMSPGSPGGVEGAAPLTPDEAMEDLTRAEQELDRLLPGGPRFATAPGSAAPPPPSASGAYGQPVQAPAAPATSAPEPSPAEAAPAKQAEAREMSAQSEAADGCATACRALSSMRRAATHLCELAGDEDARCDSARGRVASAEERVRASCSECD